MRLNLKGRLIAAFLCLAIQQAHGAGPSEIAKADFSLWPHHIVSPVDFDQASRAEIIVSALVLNDYSKTTFEPIDLGIKSIHSDSLLMWQEGAKEEWLALFSDASAGCTADELGCGFKGGGWDDFIDFSKRVELQSLGAEKYATWLENTRRFYGFYLKEQFRLAALFPSPTSEILKLDATEILGNEFKDRQFALSFDDGPTASGGHTERYISLLDQHNLSAFFFVLGSAMERRLAATPADSLRKFYWNQCLASHGYTHKAHPRLTDWRDSVDKTNALVKRVTPEAEVVMFRPPYGQRQPELIQYLGQHGARVILWNIDSQDWHSKISASEVAARVKKLMLLKRRGLLLFHDVHPKGLTAIPDILHFTQQAGLSWLDCHEINSATSSAEIRPE